jgi:hypothetical protein
VLAASIRLSLFLDEHTTISFNSMQSMFVFYKKPLQQTSVYLGWKFFKMSMFMKSWKCITT